MLNKISLQLKIMILVATATTFIISLIILFDSYSLRKSVEETYMSQIEGITIAINGRYEESHSIEDVQQIFDYIQYKNSNVLQLTLYGLEGHILASTDRKLVGTTSPTQLLRDMQSNKAILTRLQNESDGIPKAFLLAPLKEDGVTIGAIGLLLNSSDETVLVQNRIQWMLTAAIGVGLLLLLMLWLIIRKLLIQPLMALRQVAIAVKQQGSYQEISLNASQEIHEVATAFNEMVANLDQRYNELQQALETLQSTQKKLVQSEKMVALGNLVAGVSHEINTPIGIGVTAISYLEQRTKDFLALYEQNKMKKSDLDQYMTVVGEAVNIIQSNLQRASELIRSFKQVSVDQSSEVKRKFAIKQYIEEVLISLRPNLKKTKHQVVILGDDSLEINSYAGAFSQIITNFVMNSLIHAYEPDQSGNISIEVEQEEDIVILKYSDDGKGMTQETIDKVFDPFYTTNRGGGGTGLGMNIVYNIVTQTLGGSIKCSSTLGSGTTFTIEIPIGGEPGEI